MSESQKNSSVDPENIDEYNKRFHEATRITGSGMNAEMHYPCPFCCAPGWSSQKVTDLSHEGWKEPKVCKACGRAARMVVTNTPLATTMQLVFVSGPEPAPFLKGIYGRSAADAPTIAGVELHVPGVKRD